MAPFSPEGGAYGHGRTHGHHHGGAADDPHGRREPRTRCRCSRPGSRRPIRSAPTAIRTASNGRWRPGWCATATGCGPGSPTSSPSAPAAATRSCSRGRWRLEDPAPLAELAAALAPSAERLLETTAQGAAFAKVTSAAWGVAVPAMPYPVAVGHAARLLGLPAPETATLYVQAFAASIVSAGVRLIPVGQTEGQRITAALLPLAAARRRGGARRAARGGRRLGGRRRPRGDAARDPVFAALPLVSRGLRGATAGGMPMTSRLAARAAARRDRRAGRARARPR